MKRQEEESAKSRQVGMKSKRDPNEGDEAEENIWEAAPVAGTCHYLTICVLLDLNSQPPLVEEH